MKAGQAQGQPAGSGGEERGGGPGQAAPFPPPRAASSFCASVSPAVLSLKQGSWAGYLQKVLKTWREHPRPLTSLIPAILKATGPRSPPPHNGTRFGKPQLTPTKPESSACSCARLGWLGGPTLPRLQALPRNKRGAGGASSVGPPSGTAGRWAWDDGSSTRARPGGLRGPPGDERTTRGYRPSECRHACTWGQGGVGVHPARPQRASRSRGAAEERTFHFCRIATSKGKGGEIN